MIEWPESAAVAKDEAIVVGVREVFKVVWVACTIDRIVMDHQVGRIINARLERNAVIGSYAGDFFFTDAIIRNPAVGQLVNLAVDFNLLRHGLELFAIGHAGVHDKPAIRKLADTAITWCRGSSFCIKILNMPDAIIGRCRCGRCRVGFRFGKFHFLRRLDRLGGRLLFDCPLRQLYGGGFWIRNGLGRGSGLLDCSNGCRGSWRGWSLVSRPTDRGLLILQSRLALLAGGMVLGFAQGRCISRHVFISQLLFFGLRQGSIRQDAIFSFLVTVLF